MNETSAFDLELDLLLEAIFRRYQHDFRHYSRASIRRRVLHAMQATGSASLSELQHRVLHEEGAFAELFRHLTIVVSELFRDPGFYAALRSTVVPVLATYPSLKVWVAGCATGEELYSLAIVFAEENLLERTLFYATDIDHAALEAAERGIYDLARGAGWSRAYQEAQGRGSLSDHVTAAYGSLVFDRKFKKNVVFADHSLATDSVFAEVQLVTCRNVLIYFDRTLQERAVGLFTEALVRKGFLGLGSRETLRHVEQASSYDELVPAQRIYQKR